jgi:hypothetical protein
VRPKIPADRWAVADVLAYIAAGLTALWGVAHVVPTSQVVAGFGTITTENRRVLVQEWLAEAITMFGIAAVVIAVTATGGDARVTESVYRVAAGMLVAIGALTAFTGARTPVIWFKICPIVLTSSAVLLLAASVVS